MEKDNFEFPIEAILFLVITGLILVMVGGAIWGEYVLDKKRCISAYENYSPEYQMFSGCRVMWEGKITPVEIIREI